MVSSRPETRTLSAAIVLAGAVHRVIVALLYRAPLNDFMAANPGTLTWQYPTPAGLLDHLGASLLYWQQTPPLPVLVLGVAARLFGWPVGATWFCIVLQGVLAVAAAVLFFRLLCSLGASPRVGAAVSLLLLVSLDLVVMEYNSFGQTFYEPLCMVLVLAVALSWQKVRSNGRALDALLLGTALAALALTRAAFAFLFLLPLFHLLFTVHRRRRWLAAFLLPIVLLQGGWAVKNLVVHRHLSAATSTWAGSNFLHGLQQVGRGRALKEQMLADREQYPRWFLGTVKRRGLDPWPLKAEFYEEFPAAILDHDRRIQEHLQGTNRNMNTAAQQVLSSLYMKAYLRYAVRHPGAILMKSLQSYAVYWQPIRNYGVQFVALLFVEPVLTEPFRPDTFAAALFSGRLPEAQFVRQGTVQRRSAIDARPTSVPAVAFLSLLAWWVNLVGLHLVLPVILVRAFLKRRRTGAATGLPPALPVVAAIYVYAAVILNVPEHGENMRFRLTVEPLIWSLSWLAWWSVAQVLPGRREVELSAPAPTDADPPAVQAGSTS